MPDSTAAVGNEAARDGQQHDWEPSENVVKDRDLLVLVDKCSRLPWFVSDDVAAYAVAEAIVTYPAHQASNSMVGGESLPLQGVGVLLRLRPRGRRPSEALPR